MTALLHDVVDDTTATLEDVEAAFGKVVADMVSKVSQLSNMHQLLRRRLRQGENQVGFTLNDFEWLPDSEKWVLLKSQSELQLHRIPLEWRAARGAVRVQEYCLGRVD